MFQTKKPFWIQTTEIEVIFLNAREREREKKLTEICLSLVNTIWCLILSFGRGDLGKAAQKALLPDAVSQSFQREKDHFLNRAQTIDERKINPSSNLCFSPWVWNL